MSGNFLSTRFFARGTFLVGTLLLFSGIVLLVVGILTVALGMTLSNGGLAFSFITIVTGVMAVIPGVVFLYLSRRLSRAIEETARENSQSR